MHGIERSIAYASDDLPALVEVGEAVGERSMQIQTNEMRRAMGETRREPQGDANPQGDAYPPSRRRAAKRWLQGCVSPRRHDASRTMRLLGDANPKEMRRLAASVWVDGCVATGS